MAYIWEIIIIVTVALLVVGLIMNYNSAKTASKKAAQLLQIIDKKYVEFINKRISMSIISNDSVDFDTDSIIAETLVLLKPDIEGLIGLINSTSVSNINIQYLSEHFQSLTTITDSMFTASYRSKDKKLAKAEEQDYLQAFKDSIAADLSRRILDLKSVTM